MEAKPPTQTPYLNESWLSANQYHQVTPEQRALIKKTANPISCIVIFMLFLVFALIATYAISYLIYGNMLIVALVAGVGIVALLYVLINGYRRMRTLEEDFESGQLGYGHGQVLFSNNRLIARINDQTLRVSGDLNLLPGVYQFYYLPKTYWLLAARPEALQNPAEVASDSQESLLEILMKLHHFSLADLEANRSLKPSLNQLAIRKKRCQLYFLGILVCLVIAAFIIYFGRSNASITMLGYIALFISLIFVLGLFSSARYLRSPGVYRHQGILKKTSTHFQKDRRYYYKIAGASIQVSQADYNAIIEGIEYTVYSTAPKGGELLSIEPVVQKE
jgi:membrane protein YdbS with pleckstrin-like domain